jgi:ribosomal protein S27E
MIPPGPPSGGPFRFQLKEISMTNFLDMRCPNCGDEDRLDILASVWIRVCEDGTDADASRDGTHDFEPDSPVQCAACGHCGTVWQFEQAGGAS